MWAVPTSYFLLNVLMCNRRCERRERCHFFFAWTRVRITQGESRRAYSQKGKTTRCGCCMAGSLEPPLWLARQVGLSFFSLNLFFFSHQVGRFLILLAEAHYVCEGGCCSTPRQMAPRPATSPLTTSGARFSTSQYGTRTGWPRSRVAKKAPTTIGQEVTRALNLPP